MRYGVECLRVEAVRERILEQEVRHRHHVRIVRVVGPVALQCAQVVGVPELGPQLLEDRPAAPLPLGADLALQMAFQIGGDPVVVEQGVIHVEQEDDTVSLQLTMWIRHVPTPA